VNYEDEAFVFAPPSDEALQDPISPAQDEENEVSHFPFHFFDDLLFYDPKGEEVKEPLEELAPPFSDEDEEMSLDDDVLNPLFYDLESEEVPEEPLDALNP
jgi:hypothetical protein